MEPTALIQVVISVAVALLGFMLRELWESYKKLRDEMISLSQRMPTEYATKEDLRAVQNQALQAEQRLNDRLDRSEDVLLRKMEELGSTISDGIKTIWAKIDQKQDKK